MELKKNYTISRTISSEKKIKLKIQTTENINEDEIISLLMEEIVLLKFPNLKNIDTNETKKLKTKFVDTIHNLM